MCISKAILFAGLGAALTILGTTGAEARRPGLVLYQQDNFGGASYEVTRDEPDLGWVHFDDRTSSVQVVRGVWQLCEDSRFRGRCITLDHDVAKLSRMRFDDRISSVRRIR